MPGMRFLLFRAVNGTRESIIKGVMETLPSTVTYLTDEAVPKTTVAEEQVFKINDFSSSVFARYAKVSSHVVLLGANELELKFFNRVVEQVDNAMRPHFKMIVVFFPSDKPSLLWRDTTSMCDRPIEFGRFSMVGGGAKEIDFPNNRLCVRAMALPTTELWGKPFSTHKPPMNTPKMLELQRRKGIEVTKIFEKRDGHEVTRRRYSVEDEKYRRRPSPIRRQQRTDFGSRERRPSPREEGEYDPQEFSLNEPVVMEEVLPLPPPVLPSPPATRSPVKRATTPPPQPAPKRIVRRMPQLVVEP